MNCHFAALTAILAANGPVICYFAAPTVILAANGPVICYFAAPTAILAANGPVNCHFAALTIILAANQTQSAAAVSGKASIAHEDLDVTPKVWTDLL